MVFELKSGNIPSPLSENFILSDTAWEKLSHQIKQQKALSPVSPSALAERYKRGETSVILYQNVIICHLSCSTALSNRNIIKDGKIIKSISRLSNNISIKLFLTGWTAHHFRGKGLNSFLKKQWFSKCSAVQSTLFIGISTLDVALPLNQKLGCVPVKPTKYPFIYALSSINTALQSPADQCTREDSGFWVSDEKLAKKVNRQIAAIVKISAFEWAESLNVDPRWHLWKH